MTGQHAANGSAGDDNGLWARSEVMPDGSYGVGITYGPDRAWALDRSAAIAYAVACWDEATRVEHDYAVYRMMTGAGVNPREVVRLIGEDLRVKRVQNAATRPLRFEPILGMLHGPHLEMFLGDVHVGEVTPHDLRGHGGDVLTVLSVTVLDSVLLDALIRSVGMTEDKARAVIGTLNGYWPQATTLQQSSEEVKPLGGNTGRTAKS